ncbi:MAG: hypothetical protein AAGA10_01240 [Bacteroidota bacterium]
MCKRIYQVSLALGTAWSFGVGLLGSFCTSNHTEDAKEQYPVRFPVEMKSLYYKKEYGVKFHQ